ncbi:MAG: hypothetical protein Q7R49_03365 [Candidatus Daviesbacteria bacterium]|nr:hypothetical protein [Candidatus Daviesbacteria bacterium]
MVAVGERSIPQEVSAVLSRTYREKFPLEVSGENELSILALPASLLEHPVEEQEDYLELFLGPDGLNLHNPENLAELLTDVVNTPLRTRLVNPVEQLPELVSQFAESLQLLGALKLDLSHGSWEKSYYGERFDGMLKGMDTASGNYKREWELKFARNLGKLFGGALWNRPDNSSFCRELVRDLSNAAGWASVADLMHDQGYKNNPLRPLLDMRLLGFQPVGFRRNVLGETVTLSYEPSEIKGTTTSFRVRAPEMSFET